MFDLHHFVNIAIIFLRKQQKSHISLCTFAYALDKHNSEGGGVTWSLVDQYYTIPYRSLIPKGVSNMLVAGRCISSTHEAQASYRIMPTVCCIGEAL